MGATVEGFTQEQLNPQPPLWPECDRCHTPYVMRRPLSLTGEGKWVWMRDCAKPRSTCKGAGWQIVDADGAVKATGQ